MSATSTSPRQTSPPPLSSPTTTAQPTITPITTNSHSHTTSNPFPSSAAAAAAAAASSSNNPSAPLHIHPNLPSHSSQRHVNEARSAVVASLSNMVDTSLHPRASVLHENARALDRQERDVVAATEALRREREKLSKEADKAAKGLKEVGHVQNWAEVLERQFLVLEETVRLANGGDSGSERSVCSSCSCSDCGKDDRRSEIGDERGDADKGLKSDKVDQEQIGGAVQDGTSTAWSDTSRSLHEPESSTGTGMAKGSETASISTS